MEEEGPTLGLSIPSDICCHVAKLFLVLCCHLWATLDYPPRTCSNVTWPTPLHPTHTFFWCKDLVAGSIWLCFLVNSKRAMRLEQLEGRELEGL